MYYNSSFGSTTPKNPVISKLQEISAECLSPLTTKSDLHRLMDEAENISSLVCNMPEWEIAKRYIESGNFSGVAIQMSACIGNLSKS